MYKSKRAIAVILTVSSIIVSVGCGKNSVVGNTEGPIQLNVKVSEVYGDSNGIVTIISDDGFYATGENLDRIFGERGLKCTVAGAIRVMEPDLDSWKTLLENGNIDLVSHSYNHIRMEDGSEISQDEDALKHEIVDADKWFEETFGEEQIVFVCPENQMCTTGYEILEENDFWAVRKGNRGFNSLSPEEGTGDGNWFNLRVYGVGDDGVDPGVRNSWVDSAVSDRVWLIEMWHNVLPEYDGGYQTLLLSEAEQHLDYIVSKSNSNEIWVATFDEAVKYLREKQNVEVSAYLEDGELVVYANLTNDKMSEEIFNQPLTVHITIPEGLEIENVSEGNIVNGELIVNVVPGEEKVIEVNSI